MLFQLHAHKDQKKTEREYSRYLNKYSLSLSKGLSEGAVTLTYLEIGYCYYIIFMNLTIVQTMLFLLKADLSSGNVLVPQWLERVNAVTESVQLTFRAQCVHVGESGFRIYFHIPKPIWHNLKCLLKKGFRVLLVHAINTSFCEHQILPIVFCFKEEPGIHNNGFHLSETYGTHHLWIYLRDTFTKNTPQASHISRIGGQSGGISFLELMNQLFHMQSPISVILKKLRKARMELVNLSFLAFNKIKRP